MDSAIREMENIIKGVERKLINKLREVKNENKILLDKMDKMNKQYKSKTSEYILTDMENMVGKTVKRIMYIENSWDGSYVGIECEDGTRLLYQGNMSTNRSVDNFDIEDMEKSMFYNQEEIERKKRYIKSEHERYEREEREQKERKLKRLQEELK